jgi:hypothetical protein
MSVKSSAETLQPFLDFILNIFIGVEVVTSEVILHFENSWETSSANQDCMANAEEFLKHRISRNLCLWEHCDDEHCCVK